MLTYEQIHEELDELYNNIPQHELKERYNVFVARTETATCDGMPAILITMTSAWADDIVTQITKQISKECEKRNLYPYRIYSLDNQRRILLLIDDKSVRTGIGSDELRKRQMPLRLPKIPWRNQADMETNYQPVNRATIQKQRQQNGRVLPQTRSQNRPERTINRQERRPLR